MRQYWPPFLRYIVLQRPQVVICAEPTAELSFSPGRVIRRPSSATELLVRVSLRLSYKY